MHVSGEAGILPPFPLSPTGLRFLLTPSVAQVLLAHVGGTKTGWAVRHKGWCSCLGGVGVDLVELIFSSSVRVADTPESGPGRLEQPSQACYRPERQALPEPAPRASHPWLHDTGPS